MTSPRDMQGLSSDKYWDYLVLMDDVEWDTIMSEIRVGDLRLSNRNLYKLPTLTRKDVMLLFEMILENDICGWHNSYWSRVIWMNKGGPLVKPYPINSKMVEFEKGERKV